MTPGGWRGGDYAAAGDAWAHAAADVVGAALAHLDPAREGRLPGVAPGAVPPDPGRRTAPGPRLLDVGTGPGPGVLAAARAGADAVGLDLEPGMLRVAAERARRAADLAGGVRFVAGDARALPFGAGSFDVVLSTFGVMFAPEQRRCAAELTRVCRPGGVIAVASWTPDGVMGRIAPTVRRRLGGQPKSGPFPTCWGDPERVGSWFGPLPVAVRTRVERVRVRHPSVAHAVAAFADKPGPLRETRAALEAAGDWESARADLADLFAAHNRATDGSLVLDAPYLLVLGRVEDGNARAEATC
ncbi:class I SAM-dependent methyltransferase [Streptomyces sp. NPDC101249]|uniref:class I SAM-dependent methyltransferase n=1 Tax=unclassified Streptomyces TaxID=2593676 RepID=UPI00380BA92D